MQAHRIQTVYQDPSLTIAVVMEFDVFMNQSKSMRSGYAKIQPVSIVIRKQNKIQIVDMQAKKLSLEEYCSTVPELEDFLKV